MKGFASTGIWLRLLIILVAIPLLRLAPRPYEVDRSLEKARIARQEDDWLAYAYHTGQAAERLPTRPDLWEIAGLAALQAGDLPAAIYRLESASAWGGLSQPGYLALGDAFLAMGDPRRAIQIWAEQAPSPQGYNRLAQAYRSLKEYPAAIAALEAKLRLQPGDPATLYQIGLLLAATNPELASPYLRETVALSPDLGSKALVIDRSLRAVSSVEEPAYTHLAAGRALASVGEWELAGEAFRRATLLRPDWAEAWAFLGEARRRLASDDLASRQVLQDLEKAHSLNPTSIAANILLALYWQDRGDLPAALEYLGQAAASDPDNPALLVEIGNLYAEMGDLPSAQAFFERAVELAPTDPAYWRILANFSIHHGIQVRQIALPAARQAVILSPDDPASLDVMGQALFLLGDYINAERFLLRAIQIDPDNASARLHYGMNLLMQGQTSLAREQLGLAGDLAPGTPIADQAQRLLRRYFP